MAPLYLGGVGEFTLMNFDPVLMNQYISVPVNSVLLDVYTKPFGECNITECLDTKTQFITFWTEN